MTRFTLVAILILGLTACGSIEHTQDGEIQILSYPSEGMFIHDLMWMKADEVCPHGYEMLSDSHLNNPRTWRRKIRCIDQ